MKQFTAKQQKWLKSFHLLFISVWLTCGTVMLSFSIVAKGLKNGDQLYMLNYLTDFIDTRILVPAAMLTLVTGLLYSVFTGWGFFRHRWLIFKWIVTLSVITAGTLFTGPWIEEMTERAGRDGVAVFHNNRYLFISSGQFIMGSVMNIILVVTVFISVLKPWRESPVKRP